MDQTGILIDRRYLDHNMGAFHVESPRRLEAILEMIEQTITFPYLSITPRAASDDELGWVHTPEYVEAVRATAVHWALAKLNTSARSCLLPNG